MAGTFTAQNKVRPGAYTVFKGLTNTNLTSGNRGIVAIPMDLPWGDTSSLIKVTATDFIQDKMLSKIGLRASDSRAQQLREVFKNEQTLMNNLEFYDAAASTMTLHNITAAAKFLSAYLDKRKNFLLPVGNPFSLT